jgi:hypothetical protein
MVGLRNHNVDCVGRMSILLWTTILSTSVLISSLKGAETEFELPPFFLRWRESSRENRIELGSLNEGTSYRLKVVVVLPDVDLKEVSVKGSCACLDPQVIHIDTEKQEMTISTKLRTGLDEKFDQGLLLLVNKERHGMISLVGSVDNGIVVEPSRLLKVMPDKEMFSTLRLSRDDETFKSIQILGVDSSVCEA